MKWLELSLRAPSEYVEPLSVIFQRYGYGGVAVEQDGGFNPDEGEPEPDIPPPLSAHTCPWTQRRPIAKSRSALPLT